MNNKIIIFSDFDGTITNSDVLDGIITDIYSWEKYKEVETKLLTGELKYEQYLFDMFNNIEYNITNIPNNLIDEKFNIFYKWVVESNIDFYIISSGFKKIIQHLTPYINSNLIFANDVIIDSNNKWTVELYDKKSNNSINKNNVIKLINNFNYKTIFIGDGLSDFKVMGNVDYLFCKKNSLLHNKCIDEKCPYIEFNDFGDILEYVKNNISTF